MFSGFFANPKIPKFPTVRVVRSALPDGTDLTIGTTAIILLSRQCRRSHPNPTFPARPLEPLLAAHPGAAVLGLGVQASAAWQAWSRIGPTVVIAVDDVLRRSGLPKTRYQTLLLDLAGRQWRRNATKMMPAANSSAEASPCRLR